MSGAAVHIEHLTVRYGDYKALDDLGLEIPEGSFVAIVGPNGAGKSTFLKVLLALTSVNSGVVRIFSKAPADVPAQWIGYVPQIKTMDRRFPALAIELVFTGLDRRWPWRTRIERQRALEALEQVGALHLADRSLGKLSGGELQRVCLARAIVRRPRLVMLDEPATGIDAVGEADMYHLLEAYQKESHATFLMITHDWHAATHHADLVLLLNGRQISFGPPQVALAEDNLRRAYGHIGHRHKLKFLLNSND